MENLKSLSLKEATTINGGCGGEDYTCPEMEAIAAALALLRML